MKLQVLALSTALLFSTGAFAQTNPPSQPANGGSSMAATQPGSPNGAATNAGTAPDGTQQTAPLDQRMNYGHRHSGGGWWGLLGLFGLLGLMGRRNRADVVRTGTVPTR